MHTYSSNSTYIEQTVRGNTINSTDSESSFITLHGLQYLLTVYHKEAGQSEWTKVEDKYCVEQLLADSHFQNMVRQVKQPFGEIEIQASIYMDPNKNCVHCAVTEYGNKRKLNLSVHKSLFNKISQVFEKNTKEHIDFPIKVNGNVELVDHWLQESIPYSEKSYDSLFAQSLLEETKKDPEICKWLEGQQIYGQYWKDLHEKCTRTDTEFSTADLSNLSLCLLPFNDYQILEKEEVLKNIKASMSKVKTELKIVASSRPTLGFKNTSMNCGFNSCLQMILNEPVLLDIYQTVANYYCARGTEQDRLCGQKMCSIFRFYEEATRKRQKAVSCSASNNLRLAMHYLSKGVISSKSTEQEDANEILTILLAKYEEILKEEAILQELKELRKNVQLGSLLNIPDHLQSILTNQDITEDLLDQIIEGFIEKGRENILNTSLMHSEIKHTTYHRIEKTLLNSPKSDYSFLNEDNALIKKVIEWNLRIQFNPKQKNLNLPDLLKEHFCNQDLMGSDSRKFMKGTDCIEASVIKEELEFNKLPKHLCITLGRGDKLNKFTNPIEIPEELDADLLKVKGSPSGCYELKSFIVHSGNTLNSGHYTAYRKAQDTWVECNDGKISYPTQEQMLKALRNCYICFYSLK